jgi:hypothetical protein
VQVDLVEWRQRRLAAAGCPTLLSKHRAKGGFAQCRYGLVAALDQPLRQADRGDRLPFSARGGCDGGDQDQLAAPLREPFERFRWIFAV